MVQIALIAMKHLSLVEKLIFCHLGLRFRFPLAQAHLIVSAHQTFAAGLTSASPSLLGVHPRNTPYLIAKPYPCAPDVLVLPSLGWAGLVAMAVVERVGGAA
jgi:hypothetical protein